MHLIDTEIQINAPITRVWEVLTDFSSHPKWNPFIQSISGTLAVGQRLALTVKPEGGRSMSFKPVVLRVTPCQELSWKGKFIVPGLFDGEHSFVLEEIAHETTRLVHREIFTGLLVPIFKGVLETGTRPGFEAMNKAIKSRCESVT